MPCSRDLQGSQLLPKLLQEILAVPMFRECFKGFIDGGKTALKITNLYQKNRKTLTFSRPFGKYTLSSVNLGATIVNLVYF